MSYFSLIENIDQGEKLLRTELPPNESLPQLYNDNGTLSIKKIALLLGTNQATIAIIAGVTEASIRKEISRGTLSSLRPLIHTLAMLWMLTNKDPVEIQRWIHAPRQAWRGMTPFQMMERGKLETVKNLVEAALDGEVSST